MYIQYSPRTREGTECPPASPGNKAGHSRSLGNVPVLSVFTQNYGVSCFCLDYGHGRALSDVGVL